MATKLLSALLKDTFVLGSPYTVGDIITYNGSSYVCRVNSIGDLPTDITHFALLANKGDTGSTGVSGADSTVAGPQGACGVSGVSGVKGDIGNTGACGVSGVSGVTGTTGTNGTNGACGVSGVSGVSGTTGTAGTNGACGVSGVSGITGVKGDTGNNGTNGACGVSGVSGITGTPGTNGTNGACGVSGVSGVTGVKGDTGACGVSGVSGVSGADSTVAGPAGACGISGVSGITGTPGSNGTNGACGISGVSGVASTVAGPTGACGVSGISGVAGDGVSGACGVSGVAGACGVSGVSGVASTVAGPAGACGVSGVSGVAGAGGACGVSGVSGVTGAGAAGDVTGPATNSADYIPQWDGANSKKLKNGLAVPAGGLAGITALGDKIDKTTNITALNETGIADGEICVFNLTNKDIRTSDKTIVTTLGADDTTVPTSKAVKDMNYLTAVTAHNILSTTHGDSTAAACARGSVIVGDVNSKWVNLAFPATPTGKVLIASATDVGWSSSALGTAAYTPTGDYATAAQGTLATNAMPKGGGTFTGNVLFTDNTLDIGASGATRPRTIYVGTSIITPLVSLPTNGRINLTLPTTDAHCTGHTTASFVAGETVAVGQIVFFKSGGKWWLTDSDAVATCQGLIAIALSAGNANDAITVALPNSFVHIDSWNWTVGDTLYIGDATAGTLQNAIPTGADCIIKVGGFAIDADTVYWNPSQDQQVAVA